MKWIAYLVPQVDFHLVMEDGLGFIASGETQEEAAQKLRAQFDETFYDEDQFEPSANEIWSKEYKMFLVQA